MQTKLWWVFDACHGIIFSKGEPLRKVDRDDIFDSLFEEIEKDGWK